MRLRDAGGRPAFALSFPGPLRPRSCAPITSPAPVDPSDTWPSKVDPGPTLSGKQLLGTLNCGPLDLYRVRFPLDSPGLDPRKLNIVHPGRIMPTIMNTSQALFGTSANKCGSCWQLKEASTLVPPNAPRYLTHDVFSLNASLYSNFRKTAIVYGQDRSEAVRKEQYTTQAQRDYPKHLPNTACATCSIRPGHKMPPPRSGDKRRAAFKINRPSPHYYQYKKHAPPGAGRTETLWRL